MKSFDKLLISGCSFSAGSSDIRTGTMSPTTWSHFLIPKINPRLYVNLGISGAGNEAIGKNIIYLLETKKFFSSSDTLVLFNITGLDRIDTMCYLDHAHANSGFSWNKDFGFGWISQGGFVDGRGIKGWRSGGLLFNRMLNKNMGLEQIITDNALAIINTITYLESNKFQFAFMIMDHHFEIDAPDFLKKFLATRKQHCVTFDGISNMYEYCKETSLLSNDQFHPGSEGHRTISDFVYRHIDKY